MHAGHYNAIRQAKLISPRLIAGVSGDESIALAKGPSILNERERQAIVSAVKWVDECTHQIPYEVDIPLLDKVKC